MSRAIRIGLGAVRIEHPAVARLRTDRRAGLPSSRGAPASAWPQATPGTSGSTRCTRPH